MTSKIPCSYLNLNLKLVFSFFNESKSVLERNDFWMNYQNFVLWSLNRSFQFGWLTNGLSLKLDIFHDKMNESSALADNGSGGKIAELKYQAGE